ncbi:hypothetical protein COLO4_04992 [Corchorus olitorius]|uniref:Uncharacterized protein n=1 Tax=Corchorus olitorius TaxID=93759 RepID=A0A1R3KS91_9ROSI|nr:hypothetical protein COLO4_04992 [Corchorus olitorius]
MISKPQNPSNPKLGSPDSGDPTVGSPQFFQLYMFIYSPSPISWSNAGKVKWSGRAANELHVHASLQVHDQSSRLPMNYMLMLPSISVDPTMPSCCRTIKKGVQTCAKIPRHDAGTIH